MGKFDAKSKEQDGASPGKIFIGGLHRETSIHTFTKHFGKYGEIIDSVIMKDKFTGSPRGFGFITYADPSVVDKVIEDTHVINGKQVEIKRTIPRGAAQSNDFKTKKIFVGGIPSTVTEDDMKNFFSEYGKVVDHQIICDHATKRSRGFGFVIFDTEQAVDDLLSKGNMIDMSGSQVEIKKAEPKKNSNSQQSAFGSEPRARPFGESFGSLGNSYDGYRAGGYVPGSYRTQGIGGRFGDYPGFGVGEGEYGGFVGEVGGYRGESSLGYPSRLGTYGAALGGGYGSSSLGGYGREEGFGVYGSSSYGAGYESGPSAGYGSGAGYGSAGLYGGRPGYGAGAGAGAGRYHPYAR